MARPIWKGYISFGLVAIPIGLHTVEKKNELHFHLLDSRNKSRIHYERINNETGEEVPWNEVVKAYEVKKDNYVIVNDEDFERAAPESFKSIDIEEFVNIKEIDHLYFDRPYYAVPDSANLKAYVLLRESLKKTKKAGIAKVVIRTRQYLAVIIPYDEALVLNLIRFRQEMKSTKEFDLPRGDLKQYRINEREMEMAVALINDMTNTWEPEKYHDEYRQALMKWIESKANSQRATAKEPEEAPKKADEVIDFMSLLKKSLKNKTAKDALKSKTKEKKS
ncbi:MULTISPECIES: Ku protein [unclassified Legionella]|uniref:non-homologous end joining protein Ku n=1 Tax=unclassified Legionella TaxID=2622702 RepID=UPI0010558E40|nr:MULTISPECIES: Ku protein [unclassified Legionella]MDI9819025.1 Ku protein [Legionella sp. PL877]